jgi:leucyl/phenylalanyl-tRNA---protein transferase
MPIFKLTERIKSFPPPHLAEPEGLLAIGGDLSEKRLLNAYRMGIFPWFADNEPILWWCPDPRLVLYTDEFRMTRRLARVIRQNRFELTSDTAFEQVITHCATARRRNDPGTWIVSDMILAYCKLFASGYAHSIEAWHDGKLAGGLYGVSLGGCFFGESMFTLVSNASKVALAGLCAYLEKKGFDFIDCQITSAHLLRLGAREIPRSVFLRALERSMQRPTLRGRWDIDMGRHRETRD